MDRAVDGCFEFSMKAGVGLSWFSVILFRFREEAFLV